MSTTKLTNTPASVGPPATGATPFGRFVLGVGVLLLGLVLMLV